MRMTDGIYFYPQNKNNQSYRSWSPKLIGRNQYFVPWGSIHEGLTNYGIQQTTPFDEMRMNHYHI